MAGLLAGCPSRRVETSEARAYEPRQCDNKAEAGSDPSINVGCGMLVNPVKDFCVYPGSTVTFSSACLTGSVTVSWEGDGGALFPDIKGNCFSLSKQSSPRTLTVNKDLRDHDDYELYVDRSPCPPSGQKVDSEYLPKAGTLDVYTTETETLPEKQ